MKTASNHIEPDYLTGWRPANNGLAYLASKALPWEETIALVELMEMEMNK
ncbi:hypothetical protein O5O45_10260 [Hahella aquimaris]|nr:hypothetical protein [Hahella sp. HNIBRBA332]WLQ16299.1 hypothetical protein O5O45_10260 [Hahella sp. HNIBRBA332]